MSAQCAKCSRTVYKAEELKCLDKSWHRHCFKCTECGMTLTLKTYKGYNKQPYCNAHYPQLKGTTVASTPEQDRLRHLSALHSQNVYQKDYREQMVGAPPAIPENYVSSSPRELANVMGGGGSPPPPAFNYQQNEQQYYPPAQPPPSGMSTGRKYQAMYDYEAQDSDEVSINEYDIILDVEILDEGWAMGTIERTGQRGMIPSNYIQAV